MKIPTTYRDWNEAYRIFGWIVKATEDVKDDFTKAVMRLEAKEMVDAGELRGNISEFWVKKFPKTREHLKDLYL